MSYTVYTSAVKRVEEDTRLLKLCPFTCSLQIFVDGSHSCSAEILFGQYVTISTSNRRWNSSHGWKVNTQESEDRPCSAVCLTTIDTRWEISRTRNTNSLWLVRYTCYSHNTMNDTQLMCHWASDCLLTALQSRYQPLLLSIWSLNCGANCPVSRNHQESLGNMHKSSTCYNFVCMMNIERNSVCLNWNLNHWSTNN